MLRWCRCASDLPDKSIDVFRRRTIYIHRPYLVIVIDRHAMIFPRAEAVLVFT